MSRDPKSVLVVHPGAELFGSDRMLLESVEGLLEAGLHVTVALPSDGPLVAELKAMGAPVDIVPMFVLRKQLLKPHGWPMLLRTALFGAIAAWRMLSRRRPAAVYVSTIIIPQWPLLARLRGARSIVTSMRPRGQNNPDQPTPLPPHLASQRVLVNSSSAGTIDGPLSTNSTLRDQYNGVASPPHSTPPREPLECAAALLPGLSPPGWTSFLGRRSLQARTPGQVTLLGTAFSRIRMVRGTLGGLPTATSVDFAGFHTEIWPFLAESDISWSPLGWTSPSGSAR